MSGPAVKWRCSDARVLRVSAVISVAVAIALWVGPYLLRVDLYPDDAAQHVFWLYRYLDPTLFPNDISVRYFSSISVAPWGFRTLYAGLVQIMDPQLAAEAVGIALLALSGLLAWMLGASLSDDEPDLAGFFAVLALIALLPFPATDLLSPMGFQRSFALPLTLALVWVLVRQRYVWVGLIWILSALFYPIILPLLGITAVAVFALETWGSRRMPDKWFWNGALGLVSCALVLIFAKVPMGLGPTATYSQAKSMPEFGLHGRMKIFDPQWSGYWLRDHHVGLGWSPRLLLCMCFALALVWILGKWRTIPRAVWSLLLSGVGLWLLARFVMFSLYMPNRHSRWAIGVFAIALFAAAALALTKFARRDFRFVLTIGLAAPLVTAALLLPTAVRVWHTAVDRDLEAAYRFIATLPNGTVVVAHPDLADFVPLRTRHSVLASTEESQPFVLGFYNSLKPLVELSLRVAYATSWSAIDGMLQGPGGGRVILTGPSVWAEAGYFDPFDGMVQHLLAEGATRGFVLRNPPPDRILYRSGEVFVVLVRPSGG